MMMRRRMRMMMMMMMRRRRRMRRRGWATWPRRWARRPCRANGLAEASAASLYTHPAESRPDRFKYFVN
eukprot:5376223-Pyramimonas_sp.AAC.1